MQKLLRKMMRELPMMEKWSMLALLPPVPTLNKAFRKRKMEKKTRMLTLICLPKRVPLSTGEPRSSKSLTEL